ncbi:hypothetical protein E3_0150 [Rhodococcus phage E3]|uniref:hypothetical protein n=1 Tax=Rhodococcus phage E3 TaxID=1007869 RepID=UPI0002C6DA58|nr:hypothetical protein M176_gp015 [Rhodococcus phage E3]AEQ20925.1 hypothetical protein E3_0150 [Rhodococcus phage E3]
MSDNTPTSLEPSVWAELKAAQAALAVAQEKADQAERQNSLDLSCGLSGSISIHALVDALEELDAAKDAIIVLAEQIFEEHEQLTKLASARERRELDWKAQTGLYTAPDPTDPAARWDITRPAPSHNFVLNRSKGLGSWSYGSYDSLAKAQAKAQAITFGKDD